MGEEIRVEPLEVRVLSLVVHVLERFPDLFEGGSVHPVQPAKVADESPPQGIACGDGGKWVREILKLAQACKRWDLRRGHPGYRRVSNEIWTPGRRGGCGPVPMSLEKPSKRGIGPG
jgi:hypothetical protein